MSGRAGGLYGGIQFSHTKPIASQDSESTPTPPIAPVVVAATPAPVVVEPAPEQPQANSGANDPGQASKATAGIAHLNYLI